MHVFFDDGGPNKSGRDRALDTRFREERGEGRWVIRWLVPPVFPPAIQFAGVSRPAALSVPPGQMISRWSWPLCGVVDPCRVSG